MVVHPKARGRRSAPSLQSCIETLESRTLLSAAASAILHPDLQRLQPAAATSSIDGYSPAQLRHAYGFDQAKVGSAAADGKGHTIAIIDAFNDPNITNDLAVFDQQFGLSAPPSFKIVNPSGGSRLPRTDSGWAGEIALDVEWAHAIAPGANILLVETNSDEVNDLMAGVKYAAGAPGVSVVSMSWGGSEFFDWSGGEFTSQTDFDPFFTTPAGHQGVTFVSAAGDSGAAGGVQWPASSTSVVSVGGTTLNLDSKGNYVSESSWNGTSGGYSAVEKEPAYQKNVQNTGTKATPDVSYDGDPQTGFAVYDSLADQGFAGWQVVGGTSAGTPQWAALIAIADQARSAAGLSTLDSATQTLPMLYKLYGAPGASSYSTYTANFNDIIDTGSSAPVQWPWGFGSTGSSATACYDTATGLGTPKAVQIIKALSTTSSSSSGGSSSGSSGSSGSTSGGSSSSGSTGTTSSGGKTTGGSSGGTSSGGTSTGGSSGGTSAGGTSSGGTNAGGTTSSGTSGNGGTGSSPGSASSTGSSSSPPPSSGGAPSDGSSTDSSTTTQQLAPGPVNGTFVSMPHGSIMAGSNGSARVRLTNTGMSPVIAPISITLYATTDATLSSSNTLITTLSIPQVSLHSGQSKVVNLRFTYPPTAPAGMYYLVAGIQPAGFKAAPGQAVDPLPVTLRPAFVDLAGAFAGGSALVSPGRNSTATLVIRNLGNTTAVGDITVTLYASFGSTLDSTAEPVANLSGVKIRLRPGKSLTLHLRFLAPQDKAPGSYNLIASLSAVTQLPDQSAANNVAVIGTR